MNNHLRTIANKASRDIYLDYMVDDYAIYLTKAIIKDLTDELGKVKWMGDDEGWDKAIQAVQKEIKSRYGL